MRGGGRPLSHWAAQFVTQERPHFCSRSPSKNAEPRAYRGSGLLLVADIPLLLILRKCWTEKIHSPLAVDCRKKKVILFLVFFPALGKPSLNISSEAIIITTTIYHYGICLVRVAFIFPRSVTTAFRYLSGESSCTVRQSPTSVLSLSTHILAHDW